MKNFAHLERFCPNKSISRNSESILKDGISDEISGLKRIKPTRGGNRNCLTRGKYLDGRIAMSIDKTTRLEGSSGPANGAILTIY